MNDNVQRAKERAGLGTPELQAAHHEAIQAHVPRMLHYLKTTGSTKTFFLGDDEK